jgi:hypothetical protein
MKAGETMRKLTEKNRKEDILKEPNRNRQFGWFKIDVGKILNFNFNRKRECGPYLTVSG